MRQSHSIERWLSPLLNAPIRRHFDKSPEKVKAILGVGTTRAILDFGCELGFFTIPLLRPQEKLWRWTSTRISLKKVENYAKKRGVLDKIQFIHSGNIS